MTLLTLSWKKSREKDSNFRTDHTLSPLWENICRFLCQHTHSSKHPSNVNPRSLSQMTWGEALWSMTIILNRALTRNWAQVSCVKLCASAVCLCLRIQQAEPHLLLKHFLCYTCSNWEGGHRSTNQSTSSKTQKVASTFNPSRNINNTNPLLLFFLWTHSILSFLVLSLNVAITFCLLTPCVPLLSE